MGRYLISISLGLACLIMIALPWVVRSEMPADVRVVMVKNFNALMNLQAYIADSKAFSDPKNRDEIQKDLDALSSLKHVFPRKADDIEPGLAAISSLFSDYLKDVQKSFKAGASGSFVRNQARTMTGFCLSCHTRVSVSQNFIDFQNKIDSMPFSEFQRAELYAATRQFDKAIESFDKFVSHSPAGEFGYIELTRAVREVLSITVRVKQDPKATFYILEKLAGREDLPEFFQRYVAQWKSDVKKWIQEKNRAKDLTAPQLIAKANSLIEQARRRQLFPVDPAGDLNYLRATSYIHEALQMNPNGKFRGEALYLLGSAYESLQDPLLWALDSLYYEACIREFPHSEVSKKCFRRYAGKIYFGYSGSGGTFVPEDELRKLSVLRELSK